MADKPQGGPQISDHALVWGSGFFFCVVIANKLYDFFLRWLKVPLHQTIFLCVIVVSLTAFFYWATEKRKAHLRKREQEAAVIGPAESAVFCGHTDKREPVHIKTRQRAMHTQVIGTTNAGKTESVILPWAIQDIEQGRGLILIDGKSDRGLLDKLWAYTVNHGREKDFRLFSLGHIEESHQFNPLLGGSPEEVAERVFNAFDFENEYYRSVQFEIFSQVLRIMAEANETPTFLKIHQAITEPNKLVLLSRKQNDESLKQWAVYYRDLSPSERTQRISGLTAALSHFAFGKTAQLFNTVDPSLTLERALKENLIVYFQLPVLLSPFLGKASGKMILQCLQSAVANRHRGQDRSPSFFSVFLDDFSEYLYPGFVSVLNKSRSANVGVVFAHQALGDIQTLGDAIANSILTNANLKVFMRGNDPESAEYFAKVIGTMKGEKVTTRTKKTFLTSETTGDGSVREVEEFIIHPNRFKSELGVGEAVMVIPHEAGAKTINIKFKKFDDLTAPALEPVKKDSAKGLVFPEQRTPEKGVGKDAA
jgi:type IV secretory pathway TraG/TraD family ATPase VirD4